MKKRLLAVFAHPDDEAFGPGGTLTKSAAEGVEIHLLCATRGEGGQLHKEITETGKDVKIHHLRERELLKSAGILGIKKVEFLDFLDGHLCNANYHDLAGKIISKIRSFKPHVILTTDRTGVSGHLDHIAVSMVTTFSYLKTTEANKLYYYCLSKKQRRPEGDDYFVYFPEGYSEDQITTRIDYQKFFEAKTAAMFQHKSQLSDVTAIHSFIKNKPKIENFILQYYRNIKVRFPETNLFGGIE
ncbi:MAG: LmbE family protein [Candidatus Gottesmanbacteria bacterium GW2011_GWA2_43_14]|uniref:LmbE family protein n=1 Tax=Candidatus Gottesmanbacteria bacterium GW2011_GWA2_43_14 TaxID=1618443 RepID=A0A0G1DJW8_9BACT|nr:MAG: LmbE family protein [Candidatus Gottesmanbacteria bacterium GW2011_GWA2_43_14]